MTEEEQMMASVKAHRQEVAATNASNKLKNELATKSKYEQALDKAKLGDLITEHPVAKSTRDKQYEEAVKAKKERKESMTTNARKILSEDPTESAEIVKVSAPEEEDNSIIGKIRKRNRDMKDITDNMDSSPYDSMRKYNR